MGVRRFQDVSLDVVSDAGAKSVAGTLVLLFL